MSEGFNFTGEPARDRLKDQHWGPTPAGLQQQEDRQMVQGLQDMCEKGICPAAPLVTVKIAIRLQYDNSVR